MMRGLTLEEEKLLNNTDLVTAARIGPGYWSLLHTESWRADTKKKQLTFCRFLRNLSETFPCPVCADHFRRYLEVNPPETYVGLRFCLYGTLKPIGLFIYVWEFHNSVNRRLKKPQVDLETACYWYNPESFT